MATSGDVAKWLYKKLMRDGELSNRQAIHLVRQQFGEAFVVTNEYGNPALDPEALRQFRRYCHGKAEWDRENLRWRRLPGRASDDDD